VIKLDFLDRDETENKKYSFEVNLLERFTVTNPIEKLHYKKILKYPLFFALRLISPIVSLKLEVPYTGMHFVYRSDDLNKTIINLRDKTEGISLREFKKDEDRSLPLDTILTNEAPVKLTTLLNETPKQSFPFLFNSEYYKTNVKPLPDPKIKYTILKIVKKPKVANQQNKDQMSEEYNNKDQKNEGKSEETLVVTETVGYMFIRLFHGAFIKTNYSGHYPSKEIRVREIKSDELFKVEVTRKEIYCIILVGSKDYLKGIETEIQTTSQKVQPKAFGINMIDEH
jgi:hypothetical protein